MNRPAHKTEGVNRIQTMRFYPFVFTGEVPCKEVRTPLNSITFSEERDEGTCYDYCNEYQPHAVKRMFDYNDGMLYDMRWDDAGNLGQVSMSKPGEMFEAGRFLFWTEDSRMHAAVDDKYYSYYTYDHSGGSCASREQSQACLSYAEMEQRRRSQRRLKLTGKNELMDVNAEYMNASSVLNEPTLYPSAYMVLTNKGYTNVAKAESRASSLALPRRSSVTVRKHYYAGADRVCAKIGNGGLDYADSLYHQELVMVYTDPIGDLTIQHDASSVNLSGGGSGNSGNSGSSAGQGTASLGNNAVENLNPQHTEMRRKASRLFNSVMDDMQDRDLPPIDDSEIRDVNGDAFGGSMAATPQRLVLATDYFGGLFNWMMFDRSIDLMAGSPGTRESEVYYYHSDHLGGANWVTDAEGNPVQYLQYLPFGEPLVNHRISNYNERFTFTGKERDEETGYGYFGARYYDAALLAGWLSVDPMADKYPGVSPYVYCANNPVKLVDPDGREFEKTINHENKTITISAQFISMMATEEQQASLQKAANGWNLSSFIVSLPSEDGAMESYTVSFDINNGTGPTNYVSFLPDELYDRLYSNYSESGGITDDHSIFIRGSVSNNQVIAHEMGHCLGMSDTEFQEDCLMFASNTGNIQSKMLSSVEQTHLLAACGFNIGGKPGRTELCVETTIIGKTPNGFWETNLDGKNLTKNNTRHFVK